MATKRTPLKRSTTARITPLTVELWQKCLQLKPTRDRHLRGSCPKPHLHCEKCLAFMSAESELNRHFGLKPWQVSPVDVDQPECPPWAPTGPWRDSWPRAWELRVALARGR